jgi:hypothetical protein
MNIEYYLLGHNAVQSVESQPTRLCLLPTLTLVPCSAYSVTLKMEAIYSSETSVYFQRTTWCYIPEDRTLHNHSCENLKSYIFHDCYTPTFPDLMKCLEPSC